MPKITMKFNLPDEQADFDDARNGAAAATLLDFIWRQVRSQLKHGAETGDRSVLEQIKSVIAESGLVQ